MTPRDLVRRTPVGPFLIIAIIASGALGFAAATLINTSRNPGVNSTAATATDSKGKVLYYYDPMVPQEHYDNPDSLSSMGMKTVPKYADVEGGTANGPPAVTVDPAAQQNLGIRLATATTGALAGALDVTGTVDFNQRDVAIIQARAAGFVQRVYSRAPGDVIGAGAPIADVLVPEWGGAQGEYAAVQRTGDRALTCPHRVDRVDC